MGSLHWDHSTKNTSGGSDTSLCYSWYVPVDFLSLHYFKLITCSSQFSASALNFSCQVLFDFIFNSNECIKFYYYTIMTILTITLIRGSYVREIICEWSIDETLSLDKTHHMITIYMYIYSQYLILMSIFPWKLLKLKRYCLNLYSIFLLFQLSTTCFAFPVLYFINGHVYVCYIHVYIYLYNYWYSNLKVLVSILHPFWFCVSICWK